MIKIDYNQYELIESWIENGEVAKKRDGALLRVNWNNGSLIGYSDLHPWPEFGDHPLDLQLEAIRQGKLTPLAEQSLWMAKRDAQARMEGRNAFSQNLKIKNHFLIKNWKEATDSLLLNAKNQGYSMIKIKIGDDLGEEAKLIQKLIRQFPFMVRLDANEKLSLKEFTDFVEEFSYAERAKIEFVEDPLPWNFDEWSEAAKLLPLAADFALSKAITETSEKKFPFKFVVLKPSHNDVDSVCKFALHHKMKIMVTSTLGHPLGSMHALWVAQDLKKTYPNFVVDAGCLSLRQYRPTQFNHSITLQGPFLNMVAGTGVGFDEQLAGMTWTPLRS